MAITAEQLNEYFAGQGITALPSFVVAAIVDLANNSDLSECMTANGYPESAQVMLGLYLGYLFGLANYSRYITAQGAPNGASRSFSTPVLADMWRGTLSAMRMFDPNGCLDEFIPADPTVSKKYFARIGVAKYGQ